MEKTRKQLIQEHKEATSDLIVSFQFIEEMLRKQLEFTFDIVRLKLDDLLPFKFDYSTYEKAALGRLIDAFKNISNDDDLIEELGRLTKYRNKAAHNCFILPDEHVDDVDYLKNEIDEFKKIDERAEKVFHQLEERVRELYKIRGEK